MITIKSNPGKITWEFKPTRAELRLALTIQSRTQHRKLLEILSERAHFPFQGDDNFLARLRRQQAKQADADREKAASDPEYAERLVSAEASMRELEQSLEEDPNDDRHPWTEEQLRMRAQVRAAKRRDLLGEDLPGALAEMINELQGQNENDVPYTMDLLEPHILAMAEVLRDWKPTTTKKAQTSSNSLFDPAHANVMQPDLGRNSAPDPETEVAASLKLLLEGLEANSGLARQYLLCKTRTRAPQTRLPGS